MHNSSPYPLYESNWEHDACGTGFLAQVSGKASHFIVQTALEALARLSHRGAQGGDTETYDGCGILTQIPQGLFLDELELQQSELDSPADLAVGMIFLPSQECSPDNYLTSRRIIEQVLLEVGLVFLGWRTPPIDYNVLGTHVRQIAPSIMQVLVARPRRELIHQASLDDHQYERTLYLARRIIEQRLREAEVSDCYIASLSHLTIVYKGLLAPNQLARFYLDLADPRYTSAIALFHQRYSTNTFPSWPLAQPMRLLAHNGEINTIRGNQNWMQAREGSLHSPIWGDTIKELIPVIDTQASDSARLDNALELLERSGRNLLQNVQMLVPPAWENDPELGELERAWCEYHAGIIEPWDGPAAFVFTDGRIVGAALDRNGLRPLRYLITSDGLVVLASETGVVSVAAGKIVEKGRLGPGQMFAVDVANGVMLHDADIKQIMAHCQPYQQWVEEHLIKFAALPRSEAPAGNSLHTHTNPDALFSQQQLFGLTHEDLAFVLRPMLVENKDPVWSMGDDTPLAALSVRSRSFSDYFHQRFAQVTNPAIDPLRERCVMSLSSYLGRRQSLLTETPLHAHLVRLETPLLTEDELETLRHLDTTHFHVRTLSVNFATTGGPAAMEQAMERLESDALAAVTEGATLLILSDRHATPVQAPIPMLIAVGAVHQALIRGGLRTNTSLICETGAAWDAHQIALLLGYGAEAVVPFLAFESIRSLAGERSLEHLTRGDAIQRYIHVIEEGLYKIMARMGISTIRNIIGAGQFEVIGLDPGFVQRCFTGSEMHPGNMALAHIAEQVVTHCRSLMSTEAQGPFDARGRKRKLLDPGRYRFRSDGEYHAYNPLIIRALQKAAQSGSMEDYRQFSSLVYSRPPTSLRDVFTFAPASPIPLDQVESMESIRSRFVISAMSIGALSPETHRTIAAAMNSMGCRNNTGEGGEDPHWYHETEEGVPLGSKIKQVASGRFGVTTEYLVRAEEIEIKISQGSKPGEGGQLPPFKVTPFIARLRHTLPAIPLISPPPHHDIYSIEDIAQLIYDLHQVNPQARVGVKLVSSVGVGTIAAGVAKAHADYVLISGHDGGTGASPLQSIKHAGLPWERGLAETQQILLRNGLRQRVKVRVEGGLKTGRDVIIGAMLGAEEFGFGTAALVSLGCDMARQCHLNTCPTGIATQREGLRARFTGRAQFLVNFLTLVAEEVRELMAQLGIARLDDLVGRADLLQCQPDATLDLGSMLVAMQGTAVPGAHLTLPQSKVAEQLLEEAEQALTGKRSVLTQHAIQNADRSVGASLAGEIARRYGNAGLPHVRLTCTFQGSAGQSFAAYCVPGMRLILNGEANDYVGKSMTGGQIIIAPPTDSQFASQENTIIGNTVLYGATGGQLFAAGRAGERFAVRNSGALAVVEGVGDHGCEYMTNGMVVVLGETGQNFAAGMSAGVAYVLDPEGVFPVRCNTELVGLHRLDDPGEAEALCEIIGWHARKTRSKHAASVLDNWEKLRQSFWCVHPRGSTTSACDFVDSDTGEHGLAVKQAAS
ncbi:MAG TPA: glutamate synthase large subunit [Ktedonobacteraceae bacterium]